MGLNPGVPPQKFPKVFVVAEIGVAWIKVAETENVNGTHLVVAKGTLVLQKVIEGSIQTQ